MSEITLERRYDTAAPRWRDKMRLLGYYDAYLGFLSDPLHRHPGAASSVIDAGCGTGAMAEAWVAVHGGPERLDLLDPSRAMLGQAQAALARYGVSPTLQTGLLGAPIEPADAVLAAHVIEHCPNPDAALGQLRDMLTATGRLYLVYSKPHWCNAIIWLQWRHRTFGASEMDRRLAGAGLRLQARYAIPAGPPGRTSQAIVASRA